MRILGLDYGARRVGVALSDPTGTFAQPLETLACRGARDASLYARIAARVREYDVRRIVVGLPLHMNGGRGPEAQAAEAFGARVAKAAGVPVEYLDERWTTLEARRACEEVGVRRARMKQHVDAVAASLILRAYLERGVERELP